MNMRRYALVSVILPVCLLALIVLFNRWADPYQIFSADRDGLYTDKPALYANIRLHKAYQVRLQSPDALILGSSKAIQGVPAEHPYFVGTRVYNLAAPLASMQELTLLLRHAQAVHPVKKLVLALDFLSFNTLARNDGPAAGFVPERLLGNTRSQALNWPDYLSSLGSSDALLASIGVQQLRTGGNSNSNDLQNDTHRIITGLGGRTDSEIRSRLTDGGHRSNTLKIEEFFTNTVYLPAPLREFRFTDVDAGSLYWYEQFIRELHEHDIQASLAISPSHARLN